MDRCLGHTVVTHLRGLGVDARHLDEYYPQDVKDHVWLPDIGRLGWFVLTKDWHYRYRDLELAALHEYGIGVFVFPNHLRANDLCLLAESVLPKLLALAAKTERPFVINIYRNRTISARKLPPVPEIVDPVADEGIQQELAFAGAEDEELSDGNVVSVRE